MASNMGFNIFARDNASKVLDDVGDNAERLERRLDRVGAGASGLAARFKLLGGGATSLSLNMNGLGGAALALGTSLIGSAAKIATFGAAAAASASSVSSLIVALAPAGGIIAALPGAVLLGAAAFGTLKLALGGVSEAFSAALSGDVEKFMEGCKDLAPAAADVAYELHQLSGSFLGVKDAAQDAFFRPLVGQMQTLLPLLGVLREGVAGSAGAFGEAARRVVEFASSADSVSAVEEVFRILRESVDGLSPAIKPLLVGFRELGVLGAGWLGGFVPSIAEAGQKLGWFLHHSVATGQALGWLEGAADVFRQLGAILGDLGGIVAAVFRAMQAAGGNALGVVGQLLDGLHEFLDSAQGQDVLVSIFTALGDIGGALLPVIRSLAVAVASLAPTIADLAQTVGPILSAAVGAIAPALKALGPALVTVFTEFGKAVAVIAESGALETLARAIGDILVALAPLLPALVTVLVPVLQLLGTLVSTVVAPALTTVAGWIEKAVKWLTGEGLSEDSWLMRTFQTLHDKMLPIAQTVFALVGKIFTDVKAWIADNQDKFEAWGERLGSIFNTFFEIVKGVWEGISIAWNTFGGPLLDFVAGVFDGILQIIDGVMTAIKGIVEVVLGVITGDWSRAWEGVKLIFSGIWEAILGILNLFWNQIKTGISAGLAVVGETWDSAWNKVKSHVETIWNGITSWIAARVEDVKSFIGRLAAIPGQVADWFGRVRQSIVDKFTEAVDFVKSIPERIKNALGNLGSTLWDAGRSIVQGLIDGISSMIGNAVGTVTNLLNEIRNRLPFSPAKEGPFSGRGWTLYSGRSMAEDLAKGLQQGEGLVERAAAGLMGAASMSLTPSVAAGSGGAVPIVPQAGAATFVFNFAGKPLVGEDEIMRLLIAALNQAKGRGFNLGAVRAV
ncbi:hypothetical protein ACIBEJ_34290 [Nonomuraea sp. NPDC050790]|uniref:hypothetical protein n=1 Tax=Nonomuraea sp. NPDC050790 TaxID=3364371 RepID=UPI0037B4F679